MSLPTEKGSMSQITKEDRESKLTFLKMIVIKYNTEHDECPTYESVRRTHPKFEHYLITVCAAILVIVSKQHRK